MEKIKRPVKATRAESNVLTEKNFQKNVNEQLENVYDKLDELTDFANIPEPEPEPEPILEKQIFSGTSSSPTLTDDVSNFQELDIYYRCNRDAYYYGKKTVPIVNGASAFTLVDYVSKSGSTDMRCACATFTVSAKKITLVQGNQFEINNTGYNVTNTVNSYAITKVIGKY